MPTSWKPDIARSFSILAVVGLALALSGCLSTPYQERGFTGGVQAQQITSNTWRITARGNGFTSDSTVQDFALLKAAETTLAAGGTHFIILAVEDAERRSVGYTPTTVNTSVYGNNATSYVTGGAPYTIVKPGQNLIIQVVSVGLGRAAPANSFSASEIVSIVGSRVRRPG